MKIYEKITKQITNLQSSNTTKKHKGNKNRTKFEVT